MQRIDELELQVDEKNNKIKEFRNDIADTIKQMGFYSNSVPPFTWFDENDNEVLVGSSLTQRCHTLVATIRRDEDAFATFIEHRPQQTTKNKKY